MFLRDLDYAVYLGMEDGSIHRALIGLACWIGLLIILALFKE